MKERRTRQLIDMSKVVEMAEQHEMTLGEFIFGIARVSRISGSERLTLRPECVIIDWGMRND